MAVSTPYVMVSPTDGGHLSPKPLLKRRRSWFLSFWRHIFILAGALLACLAPTIGFLIALDHFSTRTDIENEIDGKRAIYLVGDKALTESSEQSHLPAST